MSSRRNNLIERYSALEESQPDSGWVQVVGANRRCRLPFRCRGSRHESAVAQLSTIIP